MTYEDDVPAEEEDSEERAWLQKENEYGRRKKSIVCQKSKGKKEIDSLRPQRLWPFLLSHGLEQRGNEKGCAFPNL